MQKRFEEDRDATVKAAVVAEIAWLDGSEEPAWPLFPDEKPTLRTSRRIRLPGARDAELHEDFAEEIAEDRAYSCRKPVGGKVASTSQRACRQERRMD